MWDHAEHEGFEIWALPIPAYGPRAPARLFHYSGYLCRHGADAHLEGQSIRFHDVLHDFGSEEETRDAAYAEGRRLIDRFHATGDWDVGNA